MPGPGIDHDQIDAIFTFHPPKDKATEAQHDAVRAVIRDTAHKIKELTPDSPEQTTAIRKLQEAMMQANAAIAIHG